MIDYTDIDAKLEEYSEAFDFYMENGEMSPSISEEDCLIGYMRDVIDSYPDIKDSDPTWVEVLKDDLISFLALLLELIRDMQKEANKELLFIPEFKAAPIEHKLLMWQQICKTIEAGYSVYDVNLPSYIEQFENMEDKESVLAALASDWESACKAKLEQKTQQMLKRARNQFEQRFHVAGTVDYEDKKQVENYIHRYPQLKEIVDIIGRDKNSSKEEKDTIVYKFLPITVAKNSSVEEIDRVESGDNLERVLPVELSMPEDLFFKRYATKELQQFSSPGKGKPKKIEEHRKDPRLTKGPIIVCVDTSGSMEGQPLKIAFSLLKQLLSMAKKQKRPCYLISFSVRAKSIDLAKPRNWSKLDNFLGNSFSGGTDGEQMLAEALSVLQSGTYEMADVLVISDFEFPAPKATTMERINKEKAFGTRFYALQIGRSAHKYNHIMDRIWSV